MKDFRNFQSVKGMKKELHLFGEFIPRFTANILQIQQIKIMFGRDRSLPLR